MTDNSRLRFFDYMAYTFILNKSRNRLNIIFNNCHFLEYGRGVKDLRLCNQVVCKIIVSMNVYFNKFKLLKDKRILRLDLLTRTNLHSHMLMKSRLIIILLMM